jgi:hypothetical protein
LAADIEESSMVACSDKCPASPVGQRDGAIPTYLIAYPDTPGTENTEIIVTFDEWIPAFDRQSSVTNGECYVVQSDLFYHLL